MASLLKSFARDESGAASIEYALIAAMLAIAVLAAVTKVHDETNTSFTNVSNSFAAANGTP